MAFNPKWSNFETRQRGKAIATVQIEKEKTSESTKAKGKSGQIAARDADSPQLARPAGVAPLFTRDMEQFAQTFGFAPLFSRMFAERWPFFAQPPREQEAIFIPRANVYEKDNEVCVPLASQQGAKGRSVPIESGEESSAKAISD